MRKPDWQADYEAEDREEPEPQATRPTTRTIYLVLECNWEYNDAFYEASDDGITHRAFRSSERASEYARQLQVEGKIRTYQVVEHVLEEGEE